MLASKHEIVKCFKRLIRNLLCHPRTIGIIARLLMYDNTLTDAEVRTILDDNSVVSTGTDANGSYTCKRPSPELIYKNWYGGQINRKSVKVQNHDGTKISNLQY